MEFFPQFELSIFGGWILLLIEWSIPLLTLRLVSPEIRKRLLDRSHFSEKQKVYLIISKIFALTLLILIIFTPLSLNSTEFYIGLSIFIIGIVCLIYALISYIKTPINEPVTTGLYKISRHPQDTMIFIAFIGICLCIGSLGAILILFISKIIKHFSVLAEEEACIALYGKSYKEYMEKIPRYFIFF
ncbi:MAG: methyltransferase family protein [Promethearchaeota archaeon]